MIYDTTCGYCRKEVKSAHGIEALCMYFNGSGIWGGETTIQVIAMRMRTSYKLKMQESIASMSLTILVGDLQPRM